MNGYCWLDVAFWGYVQVPEYGFEVREIAASCPHCEAGLQAGPEHDVFCCPDWRREAIAKGWKILTTPWRRVDGWRVLVAIPDPDSTATRVVIL